MKELIKKLTEGCCYYDSHHISCLVDEVKTNEVMNQAARVIEELSKKRESLSEEIWGELWNESIKAVESLELEKEEILQETKAALVRMQAKIDALKSGEPYGWVYEDKYISPKFILNCRNQEYDKNPSDTFLNENKEFLTPLFKHPKPSPPLLTDERIAELLGVKYDILINGLRDYPNTCGLTIVRNIEKEIRSQYEK